MKRIVRPSTVFADTADVREAGKGMSDGALMCRDLGHAKERQVAKWLENMNCFERTLRCAHGCHTKWIQLVTLSGEVIQTKIEYADGYLLEAGTGRLDRAGRNVLRVEAMNREIQAGNVETIPPVPVRKSRSRRGTK